MIADCTCLGFTQVEGEDFVKVDFIYPPEEDEMKMAKMKRTEVAHKNSHKVLLRHDAQMSQNSTGDDRQQRDD